MMLLYSLLTGMLISALALIAIPFFRLRIAYYFLALVMSLIATSLYQWSSPPAAALKFWLDYGQQHAKLMEKISDLGGMDGIIARIKKKLKVNPNDVAGWIILGKIYFSQRDFNNAATAFEKAYFLQPDNPDVIDYRKKLSAIHLQKAL